MLMGLLHAEDLCVCLNRLSNAAGEADGAVAHGGHLGASGRGEDEGRLCQHRLPTLQRNPQHDGSAGGAPLA
jgi:hypothetical protein